MFHDLRQNVLPLFAIFIALTSMFGCSTTQTQKVSGSPDSCTSTSVVVGDIITFGHYEQDDDTTNGKEPITWYVLDINRYGQYLIVSEKALDAKPYNTTGAPSPWRRSTIRSWLNGYDASHNRAGEDYGSDNFIDAAFTAEEKAKIISVNVYNYTDTKDSTSSRNATIDKIFLPNSYEAWDLCRKDRCQVDATDYAVKKGAIVVATSSGNSTRLSKYIYNEMDEDVKYYYPWWLRMPRASGRAASYVDQNGSVQSQGGNYFNDDIIAVRPALWVKL